MIKTAVKIVLLLLLGASGVCADSLSVVTNRTSLNANDSANWGLFGPPYTGIVSGSTVNSQNGIGITVSQPLYMLEIRQQNQLGVFLGFPGDFSPGEILLTNWNSPCPVTISFSQPVFGAGLQIEPGQVQDMPAPFTAYVTAYNGTNVLGVFSTTGTKSISADGSAPFLGVQSDMADITSLTYRAVVQTNGPEAGDIGMDYLSLRTTPIAPVPEPSTLALLGTGVLAVLFTERFVLCKMKRTNEFAKDLRRDCARLKAAGQPAYCEADL